MQEFPQQGCRRAQQARTGSATLVSSAIDWLLKRVDSESGEARRRAIERLIHVYHADLMSADQQRRLGDLLWADVNSIGIPDRPRFAASELLYLPAPANIDKHAAVTVREREQPPALGGRQNKPPVFNF
jgi:hypothetical protein